MILSVLLPFKESESYFQDCLDSLTNQTFQDFEVIAVNDGSKDQSSNILKKWAKSRLHVVREIAGPCQGIGMALKTGAQFCRGDFIARMDSDDTCDPCRFEVQIEALHKEPSLKLLGCNSWIIDKRNCRVGELSLFSSHDVIRRSILFKNPFVHGSVCFERKAFEEIGGYSGNEAYVEDYELWFRMTSRFPAKNLTKKLYNFRRHEHSDTACKYSQYLQRAQATRLFALQNGYYPKYGYFIYPLLGMINNLLLLRAKSLRGRIK